MVMSSKSGTVQKEGLTSEGRHHLPLMHKQVHGKSQGVQNQRMCTSTGLD